MGTKKRKKPTRREVVGERIRVAREMAKLSRVDLASKLGIDQSTLWRAEKGKKPLDVDELDAIAAALSVSVGALLGTEALVYSPTN